MTPDPKPTRHKKDLPKCRVTGCLKRGDFENGICPSCLGKWHNATKKSRKSKVRKQSGRSYPKALREAKASFQKLRRLQEADGNGIVICECGTPKHWTRVDAGHYFSAFKLNTCFTPDNVNPQTKTRNMTMHDPTINQGYTNYMIKRYGIDRVKELERLSMIPVKYSVFELEQMKAEFDRQIEIELKKFKQ